MTLRSEAMDKLFQTILNLESIDECYAYFEDLCTVKELQDMAQRLEAAMALSEGASYQEITQRISISTATIGRVSKCLNYGSGGYKQVIQKLTASEEI